MNWKDKIKIPAKSSGYFKELENELNLEIMNFKQTREVYCISENGTHKLVDDKSLATKFRKNEAEHILSNYGNAKIEELDLPIFNRYIVVAYTESKGSYTI
jgi:hypothetical protein